MNDNIIRQCIYCGAQIELIRQPNTYRYLPFTIASGVRHYCLNELDNLVKDVGVMVSGNSSVAEAVSRNTNL